MVIGMILSPLVNYTLIQKKLLPRKPLESSEKYLTKCWFLLFFPVIGLPRSTRPFIRDSCKNVENWLPPLDNSISAAIMINKIELMFYLTSGSFSLKAAPGLPSPFQAEFAGLRERPAPL
jgi:hypothetical protein